MRQIRKAGIFAMLIGGCVTSPVRAEPLVVTTTTLTTSGQFACLGRFTCMGEGTNALTVLDGSDRATLTFTGLTQTFDVTNQSQRVTLGSFQLTQSDGFTFPIRNNNFQLPIVSFVLTAHQETPASKTKQPVWQFGPGGSTALPLMIGQSAFTFGLDRSTFDYDQIVYSIRPFPFTINPGTMTFAADVGAIPEPGSLLLLGTGLIGAASALRRRYPHS